MGGNGRAAVRAARPGPQQVVGAALGHRFAAQFGRLGLPGGLHHPRQPVDDHVQKAADEQSDQAGQADQHHGVKLLEFGHHRLSQADSVPDCSTRA